LAAAIAGTPRTPMSRISAKVIFCGCEGVPLWRLVFLLVLRVVEVGQQVFDPRHDPLDEGFARIDCLIMTIFPKRNRTTPKLSKCARTCCIRMFEDRDRMDRARRERASCASSRTLGTTAGRSLLAIILIVRILT
jgi:hypothetical protein